LFGFFGWKALFIVVSALIIAIITGLIYQLLERKGMVECQQCIRGEDRPVLTDFSIKQDIRRRWDEFQFTRHNLWEAVKGTFKGAARQQLSVYVSVGYEDGHTFEEMNNVGMGSATSDESPVEEEVFIPGIDQQVQQQQ
jgi:uncharacterized membrane protein YraQ (UPF0718 family)